MSETPNTQAQQPAPVNEFEGMSLEELFGAADAIQPTEQGQDFGSMSLPELFAAADAIADKPIYQD